MKTQVKTVGISTRELFISRPLVTVVSWGPPALRVQFLLRLPSASDRRRDMRKDCIMGTMLCCVPLGVSISPTAS